MTIKEFIENVNQAAYARLTSSGFVYVYVDKEHAGLWFLQINPSEQGLEPEVDWKLANGLGETDLFYILGLVQELRKTPVKDRFPEKKYRIRFSGLNSDNGHQYLTTDGDGFHAKFFACALRRGLKQSFTVSEIERLVNDPRFKSVPWFRELIRNGKEEVSEDD